MVKGLTYGNEKAKSSDFPRFLMATGKILRGEWKG